MATAGLELVTHAAGVSFVAIASTASGCAHGDAGSGVSGVMVSAASDGWRSRNAATAAGSGGWLALKSLR